MPKNKKSGPVRGGRRASEALAMRSLVCGFAAEAFLFIVRRYANGTLNQVVIWNERYLPILAGVGAALLAIGAIWIGVQRGDRMKRTIGAYVAGTGIFVALASLLSIRNLTFLDYLIVIVPAAAFLGIIWGLYDRECALSLTALGLGVIATWIFSRAMQPFSPYLNLSRGIAVALLAALAAALYLLWSGKLKRLLSLKSDALLLYVSLALTFAGILASLVNVNAAGYAMWTLALAAFGLLVYCTMKQI
jgi:hypothetical protein